MTAAGSGSVRYELSTRTGTLGSLPGALRRSAFVQRAGLMSGRLTPLGVFVGEHCRLLERVSRLTQDAREVFGDLAHPTPDGVHSLVDGVESYARLRFHRLPVKHATLAAR